VHFTVFLTCFLWNININVLMSVDVMLDHFNVLLSTVYFTVIKIKITEQIVA
jgi:hypothetical protein